MTTKKRTLKTKKKRKTGTSRKKKPRSVHSFLRTAIRRVWLWSQVRREAKKRFVVEPGKSFCNKCGVIVASDEVAMDHIDPMTPIHGFRNLIDWGPALERTFDPSNHQALCHSCHTEKTQIERKNRQRYASGRR